MNLNRTFFSRLLYLALRLPGPPPSPRLALWRSVLATLGAFTIGLFVFTRLATFADPSAHEVDEWGWLVSAVHYTELVEQGDFTSHEWEGATLGGFGSINPHLTQWWIGLWLRLDPATKDLRFTAAQQRTLLVAPDPKEPPVTVSADALRVGRRAHAATGALCILLVYLVVYRVAGILAAASAAIATSTVNAFEDVLSRVYADGPYIFFLLLATFALAEMIMTRGRLRQTLLAIGAGAALGLAFNAKMTALAVGLPVVGAVAGFAAWRTRREVRLWKTLLPFVAAPVAAVVFAIAANPYFWPNAAAPANGGRIKAILPAALGGDLPWPSTWEGHGPVALRLVEAHMRWQRQIKMQADYFTALRTPAWLVLRRILISYNHFRYGFAATLLAAGCLIVGLRRHWPIPPSLVVLILSAAVHVLFLALLQSIDWNRYYLPAILHVQVALGATLGWAAATLVVRSANSTEPAVSAA